MISERDEGRHNPGGDLLWNESYYFNFFDQKSGLGGFTRIGMSPNLKNPYLKDSPVGMGDQMLCLYLPDGRLAIVRDTAPISGNPSDVAVGPLKYECLKPMSEWRLTYRGPLHVIDDPELLREPITLPLRPFDQVKASLDITFKNINPPVDYHNNAMKRAAARSLLDPVRRLRGKSLAVETVKLFPRLASLPRMGRANHYEQTGRYEGEIVLGRKKYAFGGTGQRDRSWGVRDWRLPANWVWLTGQFGEGGGELTFNVCQVELLLFRAFGGFVYEDGVNHLVDDFDIETDFASDGVTQKALRLVVRYGGGRTIEIDGRVKKVAPIAMAHGLYRIVVNEGMTEYTCRAGICNGVSEYLFQL